MVRPSHQKAFCFFLQCKMSLMALRDRFPCCHFASVCGPLSPSPAPGRHGSYPAVSGHTRVKLAGLSAVGCIATVVKYLSLPTLLPTTASQYTGLRARAQHAFCEPNPRLPAQLRAIG